jgi:tetratricopeptide (TPR) repeat protein
MLQGAIASQGEQERRLLEAMAICAAEGFWLPLAALIAGLDVTATRQSRDRLINSSLLRSLDRDRQRFQLHGLLREQLRKNPNMADLQAKHAAVLERGFHDWKDSLRKCSECLPELIPAMRYLWKTGHPDRVAQLAYWGFAVGERIGSLDVALAILKQEESFWAERKDARAKRALQANYGNQALILRMWGRLDEAMKLRKEEEALCLELNLKDGLQASYGNQALILQDWDRLDKAMALLKKQEELCLELGDKDGLQGCYCNQAFILVGWGRLDEAMKLFKKQEVLCLELGDKGGLVVSKGNQALILKDTGKPDEAMELLKNLEALALEFSKKADLGYYYWNWGLLARKQKDAETGQRKLQKALEIFTELNMPRERDAVRAQLLKSGKDTEPA